MIENNSNGKPIVQKENDWFLAISENPSFQLSNFKQAGLDKTNTEIKEKDYYLESDYVKEQYTDSNGTFDRIKFDKDYDVALKTYGAFVNDLYDDSPLADYTENWRIDSVIRPIDDGKTDMDFYDMPDGDFTEILNPDRYTTGFGAVDLVLASKNSTQQIARKEQIYNPNTGMFEEQSVDDRSLFGDVAAYAKDLFDPLVLATYDEDGEFIDDEGNLQKYYKGQYKLNSNGTYYYERLAGRDPIGREFKSSFDNITKIDSWAHKYDFFDSTKLEKSIGGTLMRTAVKLSPYSLGSKAQAIYGAMNLSLEISGLLSKLYRMHFGNADDIGGNNSLLGIFSGLKDDKVTLHSQENQVSFENFAKIVENMVNLKFEQAELFKTVGKLTGIAGKQAAVTSAVSGELSGLAKGAKTMEAMNKLNTYGQSAAQAKMALKLKDLMQSNANLARNISVGYMSLSQGLQTYDEALAQGVSEREAAMIAWGASAGIYGVIRGMGLGEIFLPKEVVLAQKGDPAIAKTASSLSKNIVNSVLKAKTKGEVAKKGSKAALGKLFNSAKKTTMNSMEAVKLHTANLGQKMLGSGIEEVVQQMFMDLSKGTYNLIDELGLSDNKGTKVNVWEGMFERYMSSFAGGVIGAATFHALDFNQMHQQLTKQDISELTYLANNGRLGELIEYVKKTADGEGNASKELSATRYEFDSEGNIKYLSALNEADSQNAFVTNKMVDMLQYMQGVLYQENMNMSEDSLLEYFINAQYRVDVLKNMYSNSPKISKDMLELGMMGTFFNDYNDLAADFVTFRSKQDQVEKSFKDTQKNTNENNQAQANEDYLSLRRNLDADYEKLIKRREYLFSDENILHQTGKTLFALDSDMHKMFAKLNFKSYVESITNKNMWELPKEQLKSLRDKYQIYKDNAQKVDLDNGYNAYLKLTDIVSNSLELSKETYANYLNFKRAINEQMIDQEKVKSKLVDSITEYTSSEVDEDGNVKLDNKGKPVAINVGRVKLQQILGKDRNLNNFVKDELNNIEGAKQLLEVALANNFLDTDTKQIILDLAGNINYIDNSNLFMKANGAVFGSDSKASPLQKLMRTALKDVTLENVERVKLEYINKIKDELIKDRYLEKIDQYIEENIDSDEDGMYLDGQEKFSIASDAIFEAENNPHLEFIKSFDDYAEFIKNQNADLLYIRENTKVLSESPLNKILDTLMLEGIGQDEKSLEIVKKLFNDFETIEDLNNYQLTDTDSELIERLELSLNTLKGILKGGLVEKLDLNNSFGHNAIRNEFMRKSGMNGNELFEIDSPLYFMLNDDIAKLESQLNVLKMVDIENRSNQFKRHDRVDSNISTEILNTFLGNIPQYSFIGSLNYDGDRLLDGVEGLVTPILDEINNGTLKNSTLKPEHRAELKIYENFVLDTIYNNFQKILAKNEGKSISEIIDGIFGENLGDMFNMADVRYQRTGQVTDKPGTMTNYDILINLLTSMSIKKSDFDYMLRDLLQSNEIKYAPLPGQRQAARIAIANLINNDLFNYIIDKSVSDTAKGIYKNENSIYIEGGTGVGKSSVTANLIVKMLGKMNKDAKYILAANGTDQIKNLENSLKSENSTSKLVSELLEMAIGKEKATDLITAFNTRSLSNAFYQYVDEGVSSHIKINHNNIDYQEAPADLAAVFIDEATFVNSIYGNIISKWAKKNNITIINIGDNFQNGVTATFNNLNITNISVPGSTVVIRVPKLAISMRSGNIQQIQNTEKIDKLLLLYDKENLEISIQGLDMNSYLANIDAREKKMAKELYNTKVDYHQSEKYRLAGEKLIPAFDKAEIDHILEAIEDGDTVGVIYDNENSETVNYIKSTKYKDQVDFFKPNDVQGSERDYIIIDSAIKEQGAPFKVYNALQQINTLFSRAKSGTLIINKNLNKYINKDNFKHSNLPGIVKNKEDITNKVKENATGELNVVLDGYETEVNNLYVKKKINKDEVKSIITVDEVDESTMGEITPSNPIEPNILSNMLGSLHNKTDNKLLSDPDPSNIRTYGWHMRYGLNYDPATDTWSSTQPLSHELSDLNIFETKDNISSEEVSKLDAHLRFIRSYLLTDREFDSEFNNYLNSKGYSGLIDEYDWNNGSYYLEVRPYQSEVDASRGKVNNNESLVSKTGLVYDIVYKIPPKQLGQEGLSITMGKMSDPTTWGNYVDGIKDSTKKAEIKKDVEAYSSWYKNAGDIVKSKNKVLNYKIDKENISIRKDTLLAPLKDSNMKRERMTVKEMNKQTSDGVIASDIYIYHGQYSKNKDRLNNAIKISDKLKGKAIRFVSSHSSITTLEGKQIDITKDNIADLYYTRQLERSELLIKIKAKEIADKEGIPMVDATERAEVLVKEGKLDQLADAMKEVRRILPATIRLDVLNPLGISVKDYIDFDVDSLLKQVKDGSNVKILQTFNSVHVSSKILVNLMNFRANLAIFNDAYNIYVNNLKITGEDITYGLSKEQVNRFNKILDDLYNSNDSKFYSLNKDGGKSDVGVYSKTNIRLKFSEQFNLDYGKNIDADYIGLTKDEVEALEAVKNDSTDDKAIAILKDLNKTKVGAYLEQGYSVELENTLNQMFDKLSEKIKINKSSINRRSIVIEDVNHKDHVFNDILASVKENIYTINDTLKDIYLETLSDAEYRSRFTRPKPKNDYVKSKNFFDAIVFALQGTNKAKVKDSIVQKDDNILKYSGSSFKEGMFTIPVFLHENKNTKSDFSKAINIDWLYTTDVIPEMNHVYVKIKPNELKPEDVAEKFLGKKVVEQPTQEASKPETKTENTIKSKSELETETKTITEPEQVTETESIEKTEQVEEDNESDSSEKDVKVEVKENVVEKLVDDIKSKEVEDADRAEQLELEQARLKVIADKQRDLIIEYSTKVDMMLDAFNSDSLLSYIYDTELRANILNMIYDAVKNKVFDGDKLLSEVVNFIKVNLNNELKKHKHSTNIHKADIILSIDHIDGKFKIVKSLFDVINKEHSILDIDESGASVLKSDKINIILDDKNSLKFTLSLDNNVYEYRYNEKQDMLENITENLVADTNFKIQHSEKEELVLDRLSEAYEAYESNYLKNNKINFIEKTKLNKQRNNIDEIIELANNINNSIIANQDATEIIETASMIKELGLAMSKFSDILETISEFDHSIHSDLNRMVKDLSEKSKIIC